MIKYYEKFLSLKRGESNGLERRSLYLYYWLDPNKILIKDYESIFYDGF